LNISNLSLCCPCKNCRQQTKKIRVFSNFTAFQIYDTNQSICVLSSDNFCYKTICSIQNSLLQHKQLTQ
ncbi:hypothetical protein SUGI_0686570, partial [Cryptomeria japonica]